MIITSYIISCFLVLLGVFLGIFLAITFFCFIGTSLIKFVGEKVYEDFYSSIHFAIGFVGLSLVLLPIMAFFFIFGSLIESTASWIQGLL